MPRRPRLQLTGLPVHIIQRGNNHKACFFAAEDYQFFRDHLAELARPFNCALHAYVLMTNHVHLLLTPHGEYLALGLDDEKRQSAYRGHFAGQFDAELLHMIRTSVHAGHVVGAERFREEIEHERGDHDCADTVHYGKKYPPLCAPTHRTDRPPGIKFASSGWCLPSAGSQAPQLLLRSST